MFPSLSSVTNLKLDPRDPEPVVVWVLEVQREPGVGTVGLEADSEKSEIQLWDGDVEPGDELVLQGGHPTR